ncbi:ribosomal-protein-serine acetyltransferase [Oceanobacillus picturae]|uniref:Ribosomal-protein-serine acetyltransferase n=1 Tax=Oceanobacillus picturae TaxID=171693 RepID=A0A0U9H4G3_9BACI|nr:ribosomal-protein-serine acetyltransferase [Oceanobacillus picturae]
MNEQFSLTKCIQLGKINNTGGKDMYKMHIDSENHLSILEPRHASELYKVIDDSRKNIGK